MPALKVAEARPASTDFVSTDAADLASHMHHCARSQSRLFPVYTALESAHGLVSARIVTVAAIAAIAAISIGLITAA